MILYIQSSMFIIVDGLLEHLQCS